MKQGSNRLSEEIVYLPELSIQRVTAETVEAKDNFINETLEIKGISFSQYIRMQYERRNFDTSSDLIKVSNKSSPQRPKTAIGGEIVTRTLRGKKQRSGSSAQLIGVTETNLPEMETLKGAIPKKRNIGSKSTISSPKVKAKSSQRTRGINMKEEDTENGDGDNSSAIIKGKQEIVNRVTAQGKKRITNRKLKHNHEKRNLLTVINLNYEGVETENNFTSKPNTKRFAGTQKGIEQNSGISSEQFYLTEKKPSPRARRNYTKKQQTIESQDSNNTSENLCKDNIVPKVRASRVKRQNTNRLSQDKDKAPQRRKRKNMRNEEVIVSEANKNNVIDNVNTKSKPKNKQNSKTENVTLPRKTRNRETATNPLGKIPGNSQNLWDTSPPLAVRRGRRTTATTVSYCY